MKINLISRNNGVGLSKDVALITGLLVAEGHEVTFSDFMTDKPNGRKFDVNLFVELVNGMWLDHARINALLPNPEWFDNGWRQFLPRFDLILCKTREAEGIFKRFGLKTAFVSFTSDDRLFQGIPKDDNRFFHLAGKSSQKGTEVLLRTWEKNPAFPPLTVLQDPGKWKRRVTIKNVNIIYDRLEDSILKSIQNNSGVHMCPSESEGFGHYIVEALSANAIVVTTNAPPMNEIVTPARGVLTSYIRRSPQRLAINYYVSEQTLEHAVHQVMILTADQKKEMRLRGRQWFVENDAFFRKTFIEAFRTLINEHSANSGMETGRLPHHNP
jgi:glycosyltransferase involved in cell wall biosynthesis